MSGNSSELLDSSGDGGLGGSGEEEKDMKMEKTGEACGGRGNRWPRPETLALLRIRSVMDKTFRDSTLKASLWEEISRKMMELGYKRSSKKCKEQFENVYKYNKRTKDGLTGRSKGKTCRFFDELEAFETINSGSKFQPAKSPAATTTTRQMFHLDVPKTASNHQVSVKHITTNSTFLAKQPSLTTHFPFYNNNHITKVDTGFKPTSSDLLNNVSSLNLFSRSTSSSDEEEDQEKRSRKKRKLTKELMEKQEKMHKRFLKALETRERERISREEAWRVQEVVLDTTMKIGTYNGNHSVSPSSSRWPKTEVEALIRIRKNLEANYLENGTKGPLWEEISAEMRRFGYNRSTKRCKEKWENINKYFKKVKESNKRRPLDSKTCPYFHQLEPLYSERNKTGPLPILPLLVTKPRQFLLSQETKAEFETNQRDKVDNKDGESERMITKMKKKRAQETMR
ncbi:hypothetical protein HID58_026886 [Brassica napus]|uniref:Myb-like domain-containing protein n=1 Tax=Brassica napus TaxID=3708 RepID=A0ABQ8CQB3_BRANA|nr:hypothetical protein HID58_026886 [Brassica napus]